MLQEFNATRNHFAAQDHTHGRHNFPVKKQLRWWLKDEGNKCMGNPDNMYVFNHMLRKSPCTAQPPAQGPIPVTSGNLILQL